MEIKNKTRKGWFEVRENYEKDMDTEKCSIGNVPVFVRRI